MITFVIIVLCFGLLSGLTGLLISLKRPQPETDFTRSIANRKRFIRSVIVVFVFGYALIALWTGFFTIIHVAVIVPLFVVFLEVALFSWKPKEAVIYSQGVAADAPIAKDRKTGEVLGSVVGQRRDDATKHVTSYQILTKTGETLYRGTDSVLVEFEDLLAANAITRKQKTIGVKEQNRKPGSGLRFCDFTSLANVIG